MKFDFKKIWGEITDVVENVTNPEIETEISVSKETWVGVGATILAIWYFFFKK